MVRMSWEGFLQLFRIELSDSRTITIDSNFDIMLTIVSQYELKTFNLA